MESHGKRLLVILTLAVLAGGTRARAEGYRDAKRHFSLTIPQGWVRLDPLLLAGINDTVRQRMPGSKIHYQEGFQPVNQKFGTCPHILLEVQRHASPGLSYDDIEKGYAKALRSSVKQVEGAFRDVVKDLSVGDIILDRSTNRILARLEVAADAGKVQGLSIGFLGADGVVWLHGYARQEQFQKALPTFHAIADSFRYDPGFAFVPTRARSGAFGTDVGGALGGGLIGAVVCGVAAAAAVLREKGWKRLRRRQ